jgi:hypothetical protein
MSRGLSQPSARRFRRDSSSDTITSRSCASGRRDVHRKNAYSARSASDGPPSRSTRKASARAASTKIGSFSPVNAASGVFDRTRRAQAASAFGASKLDIAGSGIDRFRNPYSARR